MPFRGTHTQEAKTAISESLKGRVVRESTRQRISLAKTGKPLTAEHRLACKIGHRRIKLFDPERYEAFRTKMSEIRRRAWKEGVYESRGPSKDSRTSSNSDAADLDAMAVMAQAKQEAESAERGARKLLDISGHPQFRTTYADLSEEEQAKSRARAYANVYQKRGKLVPQPCEDCGGKNVEKHHADYSKPLAVTWLCRRCHLKRHGGSVSRENATPDHP